MFGQKQKEKQSNYNRYIGMASCNVAGINVNDETFCQLTGYQRKTPLAPLERFHSDKTNQDYVRANFEVIFKTVPSFCNDIDTVFVKKFSILKSLASSSSGKVQAIDRFGRTQWLTPAELIMTGVPELVGTKKDGGHYIRQIEPASMRQAYVGEERLMRFISALLFADTVNEFKEKDGKYTYVGIKSNADDYVCRIDHMDVLFTGNLREVTDIVNSALDKRVVLAVGVRSSDGNLYQEIHDIILRPGERSREIERDIETSKSNGFGLDTSWDTAWSLHVYSVPSQSFAGQPLPQTPTTSFMPEDDDLPF